jgi:hypothetical protein
MDRRDKINVGGVQGGGVRIVEEKKIALVDASLELANDGLAGFGGAGEVMQESHATHQQRAVCLIERHHQVVALVGDGAAGDVLEGDHRFLDDTKEAVADDGEGDRIHGFSFHAARGHASNSITTLRYPSIVPRCLFWSTMVVIGV